MANSIDKNIANQLQQISKGNYDLPLDNPLSKKKQDIINKREQLNNQRISASLEAKTRKDNLNKDSEVIANNKSEDMKAAGVGKLNALINSQVTKITTLVVPNLLLLAQKVATSKGANLCPSPEITQQTLTQLNNIVKDVNSAVEGIDKVARISTATSTVANTIQTTSTTLSTVLPIVSAATKAIPVVPGFIVSAVDDLDYVNNLLLFKKDGTPRLPPLIGSVNALSMTTSLFASNLRNAVGLINGLSLILSECLPEGQKNEVEQISATTQQYADYGNDNYENFDNSSYKGFVIKIEEVPYTPTVNRRRAVGYTTNGVPLIQTELSFSTNNQTLVTELKLIIDRDNLKAY
jgi:hypothetical protein